MTAPAIEARGLAVQLGSRKVLDGVDLTARSGDVTAVLGPNGAGKSTLVRAIAGLLAYDGTVHLGADEVASLPRADRAKRLAYVPQRSQLTAALSVEHVVAQGRFVHRPALAGLTRADREAIACSLETTDVSELAHRPFTQLSAGEQQRVMLARALATEASIILLDEPTASLDIAHALELHELLRTLASRGNTIVVVLHDLNDAREWTDRAVLLERGRAVKAGPSREVVAPGPVRSVYGVDLVEGGALGFRRAGRGEPT